MKLKTITFVIFYIVITSTVISQNEYDKTYITLTPGEQYKAGWLHEFIFGEHWRDAWTTPVSVEVLDLEKFGGGLTPLKRGGGMQTKSLRLVGNDGNIWKFRSMKKDPSKILPRILRETVVADIFQDQISSANPLAALVAAPILTSVGILQAVPYLVYMPDDEKLGEFRDDFGGELGMIEIHPDVDEEEGREFEGADKIKSTFKLFDRLAEERDENVSSTTYLKARLIDIFLGDWDRHTDQWKWARYDKGKYEYWEPIPRDRDQVFAKWDGLGPRIAAYLVPQFVHFDYDYPQVEDITWSGRFIDRRFLTELTIAEWDSVTSFVVDKLTNEVINDAVNHLPKEHYDVVADEIISKLVSRRDQLSEFSKEYYKLINTVIDIYATNKDDVAEIRRINDEETEVKIYDLKKSGKKEILYYKVFDNNITKDIRIYLLEGDDKAIVEGEVDCGPVLRVIGGGEKDSLIDKSIVNGYFLDITPIPQAERKTEFYDSGKKTEVVYGAGTYYNDDKIKVSDDYIQKYEPSLRDRSSDWLPSPILGLNSNDGFVIGMGAQLYSYNFRMDPYEYWINGTLDYATRPQSLNLKFNAIFNSVIRGSTITLDIIRSDLLFTNYYGFGNETTYNDDLESDEFYRIDEKLFSLKTAVNFNYFGKFSGNVGLEFNSSKFKLNNPELRNSLKSEYGLNRIEILKVFTSLSIDTRNNIYFPERGFNSNLMATFYPELLDNKESFLKLEFDASYFVTLNSFTDFTFALRAGGGTIFGDYPLFESIFVGGSNDLRGYSRRRFSGDAGVFGQAEVRTYLFPLKIIVPGRFGFHTFIESGRVFDDLYKNSKLWHPSFGGGIWVTFVNNTISASLTLAKSNETNAIYANLGMGF